MVILDYPALEHTKKGHQTVVRSGITYPEPSLRLLRSLTTRKANNKTNLLDSVCLPVYLSKLSLLPKEWEK